MVTCCAIGCTNRSDTKKPGITFHTWSLISGLIVLLMMIIGACIGYVSAFLERKREMQEFSERGTREDHDVTTNTVTETLSADHFDSGSRVTIVVSPRDLERIMKESKDPPAYEDLPHPPPYEVAVAYE